MRTFGILRSAGVALFGEKSPTASSTSSDAGCSRFSTESLNLRRSVTHTNESSGSQKCVTWRDEDSEVSIDARDLETHSTILTREVLEEHNSKLWEVQAKQSSNADSRQTGSDVKAEDFEPKLSVIVSCSTLSSTLSRAVFQSQTPDVESEQNMVSLRSTQLQNGDDSVNYYSDLSAGDDELIFVIPQPTYAVKDFRHPAHTVTAHAQNRGFRYSYASVTSQAAVTLSRAELSDGDSDKLVPPYMDSSPVSSRSQDSFRDCRPPSSRNGKPACKYLISRDDLSDNGTDLASCGSVNSNTLAAHDTLWQADMRRWSRSRWEAEPHSPIRVKVYLSEVVPSSGGDTQTRLSPGQSTVYDSQWFAERVGSSTKYHVALPPDLSSQASSRPTLVDASTIQTKREAGRNLGADETEYYIVADSLLSNASSTDGSYAELVEQPTNFPSSENSSVNAVLSDVYRSGTLIARSSRGTLLSEDGIVCEPLVEPYRTIFSAEGISFTPVSSVDQGVSPCTSDDEFRRRVSTISDATEVAASSDSQEQPMQRENMQDTLLLHELPPLTATAIQYTSHSMGIGEIDESLRSGSVAQPNALGPRIAGNGKEETYPQAVDRVWRAVYSASASAVRPTPISIFTDPTRGAGARSPRTPSLAQPAAPNEDEQLGIRSESAPQETNSALEAPLQIPDGGVLGKSPVLVRTNVSTTDNGSRATVDNDKLITEIAAQLSYIGSIAGKLGGKLPAESTVRTESASQRAVDDMPNFAQGHHQTVGHLQTPGVADAHRTNDSPEGFGAKGQRTRNPYVSSRAQVELALSIAVEAEMSASPTSQQFRRAARSQPPREPIHRRYQASRPPVNESKSYLRQVNRPVSPVGRALSSRRFPAHVLQGRGMSAVSPDWVRSTSISEVDSAHRFDINPVSVKRVDPHGVVQGSRYAAVQAGRR